jgi:hypothetical protein
LSASKIQSRLLETRSVATWDELVEYLRDFGETVHSISQCAKDVKEIQRSTLVRILHWMKMIQLSHLQLTIETERQRQLSEGIKEVCEIRETVICSSARTCLPLVLAS